MKKIIILFVVVLFLFVIVRSAYAKTYICNSCSECDQYFSNGTLGSGDTLKFHTNRTYFTYEFGGNCIKSDNEVPDGITIDCDGAYIEGVDTIWSKAGEAFYLTNYNYFVIKNCVFDAWDGGDIGIRLENCNHFKIFSNGFWGQDGQGIYINNGDYNEIMFNTIRNNGHEGIYINTGNHNIMRKNKVYNNSVGIIIRSSSNIVKYNELYENRNDGLQIIGGSADSNIITNNSIHDNKRWGIYIKGSDADNNNITFNRVCDNDNKDLHFDASANEEGNMCDLVEGDGSTSCVYSCNTCDECVSNSIINVGNCSSYCPSIDCLDIGFCNGKNLSYSWCDGTSFLHSCGGFYNYCRISDYNCRFEDPSFTKICVDYNNGTAFCSDPDNIKEACDTNPSWDWNDNIASGHKCCGDDSDDDCSISNNYMCRFNSTSGNYIWLIIKNSCEDFDNGDYLDISGLSGTCCGGNCDTSKAEQNYTYNGTYLCYYGNRTGTFPFWQWLDAQNMSNYFKIYKI